jgi:formylglycine-generating enzyme required for sulfatase activity
VRIRLFLLILVTAFSPTACVRQETPSSAKPDRGPRQQKLRTQAGDTETDVAVSREMLPGSLSLDLGNGVSMEFVLIRPGSFLMGDADGMDNAKPVHKVTITKPFLLGKYEVTQRQWQAVMDGNPSEFPGPENPVDSVGWEACQAFLRQLNEKLGGPSRRFCLPTEAQWEYACRAGSSTDFCYGDDEAKLGEYGWFCDNSAARTHPVGEKKPNAWGLYDMHGNLFEWCADWYDRDYYRSSPPTDPTGPPAGSLHVDRGGAWGSLGSGCSSAFRSTNSPRSDHFIGLRVMCASAGPVSEATDNGLRGRWTRGA